MIELVGSKKHTGWDVVVKKALESLKNGGQEAMQADIRSMMVDSTALNIYAWLDWVIMEGREFSFVSNQRNRNYSNLNKIGKDTFMKHVELLVREVELKVKESLPGYFGIYIDGWSHDLDHYVAIYAIYSHQMNGLHLASHEKKSILTSNTVLLSMAPIMENWHNGMDAVAHKDYIYFILHDIYGKEFDNLLFIAGKYVFELVAEFKFVGDNVSTNARLADLIGVPLLNCYSHRFNLWMKYYYEPFEPLLQLINELMLKLRTLKLANQLRRHTKLVAFSRNTTRWSSTYNMLNRFVNIRGFISQIVDPDVKALLEKISAVEAISESASSLLVKLRDLNSVTVTLQGSSVDLDLAQTLFDDVTRRYPHMNHHSRKYLQVDGEIVHSKHFMKSLVMLCRDDESSIIAGSHEEAAVSKFLKVAQQPQGDDVDVAPEPLSYADQIKQSVLLKRKESMQRLPASKYHDVRWISPTTCIVERLFSISRWTLTDNRSATTPEHFEQQIYLRINKQYWDAVDIEKIRKRQQQLGAPLPAGPDDPGDGE